MIRKLYWRDTDCLEMIYLNVSVFMISELFWRKRSERSPQMSSSSKEHEKNRNQLDSLHFTAAFDRHTILVSW